MRVALLGLCAVVALGRVAAAQQIPDSTTRRQQRVLDSLTAAVRVLEARLDSLTRAGAASAEPRDELEAVRAAAAAAAATSGNEPAAAAAPPQQARLGQNALNPEISVSGDLRAHARAEGPQRDNFVAREFEAGFQSALDPFATAKVFVAFGPDEVEIEEGYAYFTALPGHVRLDVGKFRQQVGELNRWHLHAVPEDEYPLVIRRYAGEEGLAATGVSLYWPLPLAAFGGAYEFTVQATTGENEILYAGGRRPAVNAQLSGFWQLTRSTFAQLSVSGLRGTNADTNLTTSLGVAAARFSWRPPQQGQARELTLRGELWSLRRRFALAPPDAFDAERLGGYVDGTWKLNRRWTVSARGDYVQLPEPGPLAHEWAVTPSLTFWQSEFVFVRGIYEHAHDTFNTNRDRLSLQLVFAMGPHKHELF